MACSCWKLLTLEPTVLGPRRWCILMLPRKKTQSFTLEVGRACVHDSRGPSRVCCVLGQMRYLTMSTMWQVSWNCSIIQELWSDTPITIMIQLQYYLAGTCYGLYTMCAVVSLVATLPCVSWYAIGLSSLLTSACCWFPFTPLAAYAYVASSMFTCVISPCSRIDRAREIGLEYIHAC